MENSKRTISQFRLECCAGIKKPYFNGQIVDVQHISYLEGENGIGLVFFKLSATSNCQRAKTNEFKIK